MDKILLSIVPKHIEDVIASSSKNKNLNDVINDLNNSVHATDQETFKTIEEMAKISHNLLRDFHSFKNYGLPDRPNNALYELILKGIGYEKDGVIFKMQKNDLDDNTQRGLCAIIYNYYILQKDNDIQLKSLHAETMMPIPNCLCSREVLESELEYTENLSISAETENALSLADVPRDNDEDDEMFFETTENNENVEVEEENIVEIEKRLKDLPSIRLEPIVIPDFTDEPVGLVTDSVVPEPIFQQTAEYLALEQKINKSWKCKRCFKKNYGGSKCISCHLIDARRKDIMDKANELKQFFCFTCKLVMEKKECSKCLEWVCDDCEMHNPNQEAFCMACLKLNSKFN